MTEPGEDLVEEIVRERTARNREFPALVDSAARRRGATSEPVEREERPGPSR